MPKFIKGLAKYSNEMTKSGMLTVGDFYKNDKFREIANLVRSNEWLAKWHGEKWSVGNQRFLRG